MRCVRGLLATTLVCSNGHCTTPPLSFLRKLEIDIPAAEFWAGTARHMVHQSGFCAPNARDENESLHFFLLHIPGVSPDLMVPLTVLLLFL